MHVNSRLLIDAGATTVECFLIGVDCSTDEAKVGLAFAKYDRNDRSGAHLIGVSTGLRDEPIASTIARWLGAHRPALISIDAPLGWPKGLADSLISHRAGQTIGTNPNRMFRRETDRFVQNSINKTPLDVGADRIARTAHAALGLLGDLRSELDSAIPMAWEPGTESLAAIEVYPAATLKVRGIRYQGYKRAPQTAERAEIISAISGLVDLGHHESSLLANADILDAVVCVLAAQDFLTGECARPVDQYLAERERWIWVRSR